MHLSCVFVLLLCISFLHLCESSAQINVCVCTGHDFHATAEHKDCGGKYQSPVNVVTKSAVYTTIYANLKFQDYNTVPKGVSFQLLNNGHTGLLILLIFYISNT